MLDNTAFTDRPVGVNRIICGVKLQREIALGTFPQTALALIGLELQTGASAIARTTPKQTAFLTAVPMSLLRAARCATPVETAAMRRGDLTVDALHQERLDDRRLSDAAVDRFIAEAGIARVWAAIERATTPQANGSGRAANDNVPIARPGNGASAPDQLSL